MLLPINRDQHDSYCIVILSVSEACRQGRSKTFSYLILQIKL